MESKFCSILYHLGEGVRFRFTVQWEVSLYRIAGQVKPWPPTTHKTLDSCTVDYPYQLMTIYCSARTVKNIWIFNDYYLTSNTPSPKYQLNCRLAYLSSFRNCLSLNKFFLQCLVYQLISVLLHWENKIREKFKF